MGPGDGLTRQAGLPAIEGCLGCCLGSGLRLLRSTDSDREGIRGDANPALEAGGLAVLCALSNSLSIRWNAR